MRNIILFFGFLLTINFVYSQKITNGTFSTAGDYSVGQNGVSISWTMGEVFSETIQQEQHLTEGFQQGNLTRFGKVNLTATRQNATTVYLNWEKIGSITAKQFVLQRRKANEANFTTIAIVKNDLSKNILKYSDKNDFEVETFYRIEYAVNTTLVATNIEIIEGVFTATTINVFPNPTVEQLNIGLSGVVTEVVTVNIWNVKGETIFTKTYKNIDNQTFTIAEVEQLGAGQYIVQVKANDTIIGTKQFIKL